MTLFLSLLLCGSAVAQDAPDRPESPEETVPAEEDAAETPEEAPETPAEVPEVPEPAAPRSYEELLEAAKTTYFDGGHAAARELLTALAARIADGEEVPRKQATETLIYLGEIQYQTGDEALAWDTFRSLLDIDPEYKVSPYHHPTDVIAWFELVRQQVEQDRPPEPEPDPTPDPVLPPPPIPPAPAWTWLPFGIPQARQGHGGRAVVYGTLQVAFGAASIGSYLYINSIDCPLGDDSCEHGFDSPEEMKDHVRTLYYTIQWPSSGLFYVTWLASHLDARGAWRASHREPLEVSLHLGPRGLAVSGRF